MLIIKYYYNININIMKYFEGEFIKTEEIDIKKNELEPNIFIKDVRLCFINKNKIIIMGNAIYSID